MRRILMLLIMWFVLGSAETMLGQPVLLKMKASQVKPSNAISIRDTSKVILVVKSVIKNLQFETTHGKIDIQRKMAGEWWLYLEPGTHILTFSADGFQSLTNLRAHISKADKSKEIEIEIDKESLETVRKMDWERPIIIKVEHTTEGDTVNWLAVVIDNIGVFDVKLFYRSKGEQEYKSEDMQKEEGDKYQTKLAFKVESIEYYLEARDVSGNEPTKWKNAANPQLIVVHPTLTGPTKPAKKRSKKLLWFGVGAAAIGGGLVAALAGGGGGSLTTNGGNEKLPDPPGGPTGN